VFLEREMGIELARSLTTPKILDYFEIDPDHSIVEIKVPEEFDGQTIIELELRKKYGLNVLAVSSGDDKFEINPLPNKRLIKGNAIVVLGSNKQINRLAE
ncbi:MAG: TrkA family potassium uptake protein, partial [Okeania sp. SIO2H7]|nr:TrkA family potassium uptake protein [Okeania sp. SIO2H7]